MDYESEPGEVADELQDDDLGNNENNASPERTDKKFKY